MSTQKNEMIDPVCMMIVDAEALHVEYLGLHFYFCSEQCRERFVANPHLYTGKPGQRSPKQQGVHVIKQRVIRLELPATEAVKVLLVEGLMSMMGIKEVNIENDLIRIRYDLLEATAEQIEKTIEQSDTKLGRIWKERLKRAFVHYIEETELENLENQHESHGCHHNDK